MVLRKVSIEVPSDPATPHLGVDPEETKTERHLHPKGHGSTRYSSKEAGATEVHEDRGVDTEGGAHTPSAV